MEKNPTFFIMTYGLVASGKSLLTRFIKKTNQLPTLNIFLEERYGKFTNFEIISSDQVRVQIYEKTLKEIFTELKPDKEKLVWEYIEARVLKNLALRKRSTILDATSLYKKDRLYYTNVINALPGRITKILLVVNISLEIAMERNNRREAKVPEDVIRKMYEIRNDINEQPNLDEEMWDLIYYFDSNKIKLEV